MAASVGLECIMWRQTGGCVSDGPREPYNDKGCVVSITRDLSGYCECVSDVHISFDCDAASSSFTCAEKCSAVEGPTKTQTQTQTMTQTLRTQTATLTLPTPTLTQTLRSPTPTLTHTVSGTETIPSECVDVTLQRNTATCKGSYRLIPASTAHACHKYLCELLISEEADMGVTGGDTVMEVLFGRCYVRQTNVDYLKHPNWFCEPGPEEKFPVIVPITSALAVLGVAAVAVLWWTRRPPLPAVQTGPHGATELREDHPLVSKV
eukprot:TRINITY_DN1404_c0_g1_i16.p1 TRINITY_DN1404_c0_g1~~TRINITY_DN1404_c0_g1_i16.p1  ORF type:complete len:264 (+),score=6.45 TRINITY_DN1404_c0_g1_i16:2-793(+)